MIKKILVPLDGSQQSRKALDFALDFAEKYDSEIALLSVVPPVNIPIATYPGADLTSVPVATIETYQNEVKSLHTKILRDAQRRILKMKPKIKISVKQVEGNPAGKILQILHQEKFDIIIMGHRGASGIKEFFLGSVTHRVAHKCPCPIIIIK